MHIMNHICKEYKELKLDIKNKGSYLDDLEELKTIVQDNWDTSYCDKDTDDDSADEEIENQKKKGSEFNVTDKKFRTWKGSNEKMICSHCATSGHSKNKIFKLIGCPTNWEGRRTCFKCNKTGNIARKFSPNMTRIEKVMRKKAIYILIVYSQEIWFVNHVIKKGLK